MKRTTPWVALILAALVAAGAGAASARADGLPVLGVDAGPGGVAGSTGDARYVTLPAGKNTVVARVDPKGGRIVASRFLTGTFTVPAVAYDGSSGGLSGDGRTLILIRPRLAFPRARTPLLALGTKSFVLRREVRLRGDFSYDAVSPNGAWLYLIQYVSPSDPTRYAVRVYDLRHGRLLARPVTDPNEPGPMHGSPLPRATSADGRWAYTLYDGLGKTPFIHALDTSTRSAHCVDLPGLAGIDLSGARLSLSGDGTLTVSDPRPVAVMDTRTFLVGPPARAVQDRAAGFAWMPVALVFAALAAGGVLLLALRRRRRRLGRHGGASLNATSST
jgi:hypothetical protein